MSFLDDAVDSVTDFAKDALGINSVGPQITVDSVENKPYKPNKSDWHKALPYGFKFNPRQGKSVICYLPLAPENIAVSTHFGTNIIPTLYGTIEEHSEQRYYDIVISGTTGFAPKYTTPFISGTQPQDKKLNLTGRKSYKDEKVAGIDPNLAGGFFQKSIGALNQGLNAIVNMYENFNGTPVLSGVDPETSGYIAFHNMYRYLLAYKRDAAGLNVNTGYSQHPLTFLNYKDHIQYNCAITKFDLKRSATQPMLYNYTIIMRAYNLRDIAESIPDDTITKRLQDLGLAGIGGSVFKKLKQTSNGAKGVIGAISGGLNVLGG
ncbi:MAG: hypothetical protein Q9M19_05670 [Mariprofundaceae bacterium]|nr:hypothetical protein [Mariprofundaceae bacterium]